MKPLRSIKSTSWIVASALGATIALSSTSVFAEEFTRRRYVLPDGDFEITGEPARPRILEVNVAPGDFAEPTYLPPHIYFGVTNDLTLGITHWRGICLIACGGRPYNDVGFKVMYELTRSNDFELDLDAGVQASSLDPFQLHIWGGVLGRVNFSSMALVFNPRLYVGAYDATSWIDLPAWLYFQPSPSVAPFVGLGISGPVEGFADGVAIPVEGGVVFEASQNIDLGVVWTFRNLLGSGGSFDNSSLGMLARFRG